EREMSRVGDRVETSHRGEPVAKRRVDVDREDAQTESNCRSDQSPCSGKWIDESGSRRSALARCDNLRKWREQVDQHPAVVSRQAAAPEWFAAAPIAAHVANLSAPRLEPKHAAVNR